MPWRVITPERKEGLRTIDLMTSDRGYLTAPTAGTFRSSSVALCAHNVDDGGCSVVMTSTLSIERSPHTLMTETAPDTLDNFSSRGCRSLRYPLEEKLSCSGAVSVINVWGLRSIVASNHNHGAASVINVVSAKRHARATKCASCGSCQQTSVGSHQVYRS